MNILAIPHNIKNKLHDLKNKFVSEIVKERVPYILYDTEKIQDIEKYFGKDGNVTMHIISNDILHWRTRLVIQGKCIGEFADKKTFDRIFFQKKIGNFKGLGYHIENNEMQIFAKMKMEKI